MAPLMIQSLREYGRHGLCLHVCADCVILLASFILTEIYRKIRFINLKNRLPFFCSPLQVNFFDPSPPDYLEVSFKLQDREI